MLEQIITKIRPTIRKAERTGLAPMLPVPPY
jgi:hypothetical protein